MKTIELFKPVKHLIAFENMFPEALEELQKSSSTDIESKKTLINQHKKNCLFNKKIFMYVDEDTPIGFCMYEEAESFDTKTIFLIFDFVDKKHRGKGRYCRKEIIEYFSDKCDELKFTVDTFNFLSINSVNKLNKMFAGTGVGVLRKHQNPYYSSKSDYTVIYY